MATVEKTIQVSKEADELGMMVAKMVEVGKAQLADGFQIGEDLPAILVGVMNEMLTGIEGVDKLKSELDEDPAAFMMAWLNAGAEVYAALKA